MRLAALLLVLLPAIAAAQISSTRVSEFDYQCQEADGTRISNHTRPEIAANACANLSLQDGKERFVQGGRWRITAARPSPAAPSTPDPAVLGRDALLTIGSGPTHYTDGSAIAPGTPISFRIYRSVDQAPAQRVVETTQRQLLIVNNPVGSVAFYATAVVNGVESAPSGIALKVFQ